MSVETNNNDNLFPPLRHNRDGFTQEEIQDILRFAKAHDIQGAAKAKLFALIRDLRATHAAHRYTSERQKS